MVKFTLSILCQSDYRIFQYLPFLKWPYSKMFTENGEAALERKYSLLLFAFGAFIRLVYYLVVFKTIKPMFPFIFSSLQMFPMTIFLCCINVGNYNYNHNEVNKIYINDFKYSKYRTVLLLIYIKAIRL